MDPSTVETSSGLFWFVVTGFAILGIGSWIMDRLHKWASK